MREALTLPGSVRELFGTAEALARHGDIAAMLTSLGIPVHVCDEAAVAALAGSVSPQGLVAVCRFLDVPLETALIAAARLVAVAANVRDPGNLGTLIRCADAAGADLVVVAGTSADPYADKVVRASVGSIFHLPLVVGTALPVAVQALRDGGLAVLAADGAGSETVDVLAASGVLDGPVAWVFGNEAWGLSADDLALCDRQVAVPVYGRAESLNVATAAAVCLYATAWAQRSSARAAAPAGAVPDLTA